MRAVIVNKPDQRHEYEVYVSAGDMIPAKACDLVLDSMYLTGALAIHRAKYLDDLNNPLYFRPGDFYFTNAKGEIQNETKNTGTEAPSTGQAGRSNETKKGEGIV